MMTDVTQALERAIKAAEQEIDKVEMVLTNPVTLRRMQAERVVRAVLMAVLPTLKRYDSDYAGQYKDERGDYVLYADLQAILNDGEGE